MTTFRGRTFRTRKSLQPRPSPAFYAAGGFSFQFGRDFDTTSDVSRIFSLEALVC